MFQLKRRGGRHVQRAGEKEPVGGRQVPAGTHVRGALYTVGRNGDAMRLEGASRGHATIQEKGGQAGMATVEGGLGTAGLFDRWQLSRKAWSEPVAEGVETKEPV